MRLQDSEEHIRDILMCWGKDIIAETTLLSYLPHRALLCVTRSPRGLGELGALLTLLGCVFTVNDPGQAKVPNFAAQGLRHQDVGCPQVPVNGVHLLNIRHPFSNLRKQTHMVKASPMVGEGGELHPLQAGKGSRTWMFGLDFLGRWGWRRSRWSRKMT